MSMLMEGALAPVQDRNVPPLSSTEPASRADALAPPRKTLPAEVGHILDTGSVLVVLALVWAVTHWEALPAGVAELFAQPVSLGSTLLVGGFAILWPRLLILAGLYPPGTLPRREEVMRVLGACTAGALLAWLFALPWVTGSFHPAGAAWFWLGAVGFTLSVRAPLWQIAARARPGVPRRILIVGSGPRALRLAGEIRGGTSQQGLELIGYVDSDDHAASEEIDAPKLGSLEALEEILMHHVVDEVLIALPIKSCYTRIQDAIGVCERVGVESKYLADAFRCSLARPRFEHRGSGPFVAMKVVQDDYRVWLKRALDVVAALAGLLVLFPVLLVIAAAVKLDSHGPVLFAQERYGRGKRRFRMLKFRTMVPNAEALQAYLEEQNEAIGPVFKIRDDPRITRVGRFLRKTSLDELPQLVNVLLGDMSLVGPRPLPVRDVQLFDQAWFMRRFSVSPGITGLWQISGRSNLGFDDWVTLDLKYIDEWSLSMDLRILARTVPAVVRGVGAA